MITARLTGKEKMTPSQTWTLKRAVFGKGGNINIDTADRLMAIFENEKGGKNVKV